MDDRRHNLLVLVGLPAAAGLISGTFAAGMGCTASELFEGFRSLLGGAIGAGGAAGSVAKSGACYRAPWAPLILDGDREQTSHEGALRPHVVTIDGVDLSLPDHRHRPIAGQCLRALV